MSDRDKKNRDEEWIKSLYHSDESAAPSTNDEAILAHARNLHQQPGNSLLAQHKWIFGTAASTLFAFLLLMQMPDKASDLLLLDAPVLNAPILNAPLSSDVPLSNAPLSNTSSTTAHSEIILRDAQVQAAPQPQASSIQAQEKERPKKREESMYEDAVQTMQAEPVIQYRTPDIGGFSALNQSRLAQEVLSDIMVKPECIQTKGVFTNASHTQTLLHCETPTQLTFQFIEHSESSCTTPFRFEKHYLQNLSVTILKNKQGKLRISIQSTESHAGTGNGAEAGIEAGTESISILSCIAGKWSVSAASEKP